MINYLYYTTDAVLIQVGDHLEHLKDTTFFFLRVNIINIDLKILFPLLLKIVPLCVLIYNFVNKAFVLPGSATNLNVFFYVHFKLNFVLCFIVLKFTSPEYSATNT